MRTLMLLVAVFVWTGSLLSAEDPMIGTWKLNFAKSRFPATSRPSNFKEAITVFREIENELVEKVSTETQKDGKTVVARSTAPKSGGFVTYQEGDPAPGTSLLRVVIDPYTMYDVHLVNGKQVLLRKATISQDLKTYTLEIKYKDAQGTPVEILLLYEKQ